jgi:DNA mismatch endonuclease (patch repair protein)
MARIRSKDTGPELLLRRALHSRGLRYRIHAKNLPGRPDIAFTRARVAVFVDGDYWHGWNFPLWRDKLQPYWRGKIERNMARDLERTAELQSRGWLVLRFWEHDVKGNLHECADTVEMAVHAVRLRRHDTADE